MRGLLRAGKLAVQTRRRDGFLNAASSFLHVHRNVSTTAKHPVTKIEKILLDTIKATGPISFSDYMRLCLSHPTEGYYTKPLHDILGSRGDFVTSPEISQVFGELVGIWLLSQWLARGRSCPLRIVELGPGTGTLMYDLLRVFMQFPASSSALTEIHLVEMSPTLRLLQERKLDSAVKQNGWKIYWHDSIEDIPRDDKQYTMLVAHEFFDALPFHLIEKTQQGWQEVKITSAPDPSAPTILTPSNVSALAATTTQATSSTQSVTSHFRHVLSSEPTASSLLLGRSSLRFKNLPVGTRVEVSPTSFRLARKVAELLSTKDDEKRAGGSALIVDYGDDRAFGNSFRAFKNHKIVDVFHRPGDCDLTVNVDFAYLKEAMSDLVLIHGIISQADFLTRMGINVRTEALTKSAQSEERKDDIDMAAKRLVDLNGMGTQYKVLGITSAVDPSQRTDDVWPFVKLDPQLL